RAVEKARMTAPGLKFLGTVVAGKDADRIVLDSQFFDGVEDRSKIRIKFGQAICPVTLAGLSLELGSRDSRKVHQRVIEVQKEGRSRVNASLHKRFAARQEFSVDVSSEIERELFDRSDLTALTAFQNIGDPIASRVVPRIFGPQALIPGTRDAVPF